MQNTEDAVTCCIAITFCDDANNRFVTLGGAGFLTEEAWELAWNSIPTADTDPIHCIADKLNENGDIVEDRPVSRETVETLLGKPIQQLIEEALPSQQS
jgi:hypothetical protein